jgi:DNA-binding response OmpR family regulator
MRKRVLMAEQSDAIRGIAETVLRQNGFEVISVAAAEKALEVLKFSRPDLIIVGADLTTADQKPLYERLQADPKTASIAMLLFDDPDNKDLPFPSEVIIPRPFDPKEFLEKVAVFSGTEPKDVQAVAAANPLDSVGLDDDLLDAALGLDRIDVTDSEVMNRRETGNERSAALTEEKYSGIGMNEKVTKRSKESGKVETVMIREHAENAHGTGDQQQKPQTSQSASGELEILTDQYGLTDAGDAQEDDQSQVHDYEWFINEMRKDVEAPSPPSGDSTKDSVTTSELPISEPASMVDPITPPPATLSAQTQQPQASGVEKFINEFKKEVEKAHADATETIMLEAEQTVAGQPDGISKKWEETFENLTAEQMNLFTRQLCADLAEKIAEKIVSKIDADKLLNLIKKEILQQARNKTYH